MVFSFEQRERMCQKKAEMKACIIELQKKITITEREKALSAEWKCCMKKELLVALLPEQKNHEEPWKEKKH